MAETRTWVVESAGRAGEVLVEVLAGDDGQVLSVETPGWSFVFRASGGDVAAVAAFLRAHAGRAAFAECVVGSFFGRPVRLINDDEFSDRLWLRVSGEGQVADFPLVGESAGWFVAAVTETAAGLEPGAR